MELMIISLTLAHSLTIFQEVNWIIISHFVAALLKGYDFTQNPWKYKIASKCATIISNTYPQIKKTLLTCKNSRTCHFCKLTFILAESLGKVLSRYPKFFSSQWILFRRIRCRGLKYSLQKFHEFRTWFLEKVLLCPKIDSAQNCFKSPPPPQRKTSLGEFFGKCQKAPAQKGTLEFY